MLMQKDGIDENLKFLILEVRGQLERTLELLQNLPAAPDRRLNTKDDYIDNLKTVIQRKCFELAAEVARDNRPTVDLLKAIDTVAVNLERIADFCENVHSQTNYILEPEVMRNEQFEPFLRIIIDSVDLVETALFERATQRALQICRAEDEIDHLYKDVFQGLLEELKSGERTQSLVTAIFIYRYFERMGDSLLNIGEAILSAFLGERIKIGQFEALEDSLEDAALADGIESVQLHPVKETKSGSLIERVESRGTDGVSVIFKDGPARKIREEKDGVRLWGDIDPNLVPKIHSFHEHGDGASILFEFLSGRNFEDIVLGGTHEEVDTALESICDVLQDFWRKTRWEEPVPAHFLKQLRDRLPDIYQVHPEFAHAESGIGEVEVPTLQDSLEHLDGFEEKIQCPFSFIIHGDFNLDNVIYDAETGRVSFVDLHRARRMDYVQDVSVFLVSCFRLPADRKTRHRLHHIMGRFLQFGRAFAASEGDATFEARLTLGLARSFATSTRFLLDRRLAKSLFLRARYLVTLLVQMKDEELADFVLPGDILID